MASLQYKAFSWQHKHNAASLSDDFNQNADKARVASSRNQLQIWLKEANADLPAEDQATAMRLDELTKRRNVKVVYMKLYASLCLQTHDQLSVLAADVGVSPEDLLTQTNGPWLLGRCCLSLNSAPLCLLDCYCTAVTRLTASRPNHACSRADASVDDHCSGK